MLSNFHSLRTIYKWARLLGHTVAIVKSNLGKNIEYFKYSIMLENIPIIATFVCILKINYTILKRFWLPGWLKKVIKNRPRFL